MAKQMLSDSETVVAGIFVTVVIAVIIVVIVIVLAATRPSPPTETSLASRYVGYIHNPKRIHVTPKELILGKVPLGWNWYDIGQEQKEWFEDKWSGQIKLNETKYTTPVMNQHMPLYCGSCYLMAAVQMVADRFWIKTGKRRILDVLLSSCQIAPGRPNALAHSCVSSGDVPGGGGLKQWCGGFVQCGLRGSSSLH